MEIKSKINLYYLGKSYPLFTTVDESVKKITVDFDGSRFLCISAVNGEMDISEGIKTLYIKLSRRMIEERLKLYQPNFKVKYKRFSIVTDRNKWGSCNSNRELTFNWRLTMLPIEIIDYVVVHELCHLIHLNHDRSFWRLLGKVYPNFKEAMAFLGTEKQKKY